MVNKYKGTFTDIFRSKRFSSSIVIALLTVLAVFVPELEEHIDKIIPMATASIIALVSGYSIQDVVISWVSGEKLIDLDEIESGSVDLGELE